MTRSASSSARPRCSEHAVERRNVSLLAVVVAAALVSFVIPGPAGASGVRDHQRITREALRDVGWTDDERIERVVRCNLATDMARLRSFYRESLAVLFPETGRFVEPVLDLTRTAPFNSHGTDGFHFNNLYSYSAIEQTWRALGVWADSAASAISASSPDADDPRTAALLGIAAHAVQDFYSHSNWVQLLDPFTPGTMLPEQFPLWEELVDENSAWLAVHPGFDRNAALARLRLSDGFTSRDDRAGGLQTGKARGAPKWSGEPPWEHRHLEGAQDAVVDALARRASVLWMRRVQDRLDSGSGARSSFAPPSGGPR